MNTNVITRHIGIGMLAFCATFVQTSMFVASHFGSPVNTPSIQVGGNIAGAAYARLDAAYARGVALARKPA